MKDKKLKVIQRLKLKKVKTVHNSQNITHDDIKNMSLHDYVRSSKKLASRVTKNIDSEMRNLC